MKLWAPRVLGLDLSLTGTGICRIGAGGVEILWTVRPRKLTGHPRLEFILDAIYEAQHGAELDLVMVEGPSYGSQGGQRGHHERGGLWWLVTHSLYARRRSYGVVAPKARAKYATGDGNAGKREVLAAARQHYGHLADIHNDNEADALVIAAMGADHCGDSLAAVPEFNRAALRRVAWPELPSDD